MSQGWICVHRKLLDNPIFKNDKLFRVFMYCLLKASHTKHDQLVGDTMVSLESGQLVTGRKAMSSDTGLSEQNVRTAMSKLEKLGILTSKPTNKFSVISITNWQSYQQTNQQLTSSQPTTNQQVTTNNNVNNDNNEDKQEIASPKADACPYVKIKESYNEILGNDFGMAKVLNSKRKTAIKKFFTLLEGKSFAGYFGYFGDNAGPFYRGENDRSWKATFDYIIREDTIIKVMEGNL